MDKSTSKRKLWIFTIFSLLFFIFWNNFVVKPLIEKQKQAQNKNAINVVENIAEDNKKIEEQSDVKENIVIIENDYILGDISTKGLIFDNIYLKKYKKTVDSEEFVQILNKDFSVNFGILADNIKVPTKNTIWNYEGTKVGVNSKVTFAYDNKEGIIFKVVLSMDDKYMLNIEQIIENKSDKEIKIKPYTQIQKKYILDKKNFLPMQISGVFNRKLEEVKLKRLDKKNLEFNNSDWFSISDKYWSINIIPESKNTKVNFLKDGDIYKAQSTFNEDIIISPNSTFTTKNKLFTGAKELKILDYYQKTLNIPMFDRIVDFGSLYILTKPLYLLLRFINNIVGNFGVAILILTLLVKMLLYPSTKKSFVSIARMKKIQPEMTRIQELYKNNKLELNQRLMKLYKDNDVNPLSGCLPMLLQIPVFFALYKVFVVAIEMRHAKFFGYIKDLSVGDPTSIFNLFGLFPFEVGLKIGLLPCLTALTMYIQQKLSESSNGMDQSNPNTQAMAVSMKYMPLMFLFMFSSFPMGLLLYWIFSNIISIIQQIWINKKVNSENVRKIN